MKKIMVAHNSKYSLRDKVEGGEEIKQPHGNQDCHPAEKFAPISLTS